MLSLRRFKLPSNVRSLRFSSDMKRQFLENNTIPEFFHWMSTKDIPNTLLDIKNVPSEPITQYVAREGAVENARKAFLNQFSSRNEVESLARVNFLGDPFGTGKTTFISKLGTHIDEWSKSEEINAPIVIKANITFDREIAPYTIDQESSTEQSLALRLLHTTLVANKMDYASFYNELKESSPEITEYITIKSALEIIIFIAKASPHYLASNKGPIVLFLGIDNYENLMNEAEILTSTDPATVETIMRQIMADFPQLQEHMEGGAVTDMTEQDMVAFLAKFEDQVKEIDERDAFYEADMLKEEAFDARERELSADGHTTTTSTSTTNFNYRNSTEKFVKGVVEEMEDEGEDEDDEEPEPENWTKEEEEAAYAQMKADGDLPEEEEEINLEEAAKDFQGDEDEDEEDDDRWNGMLPSDLSETKPLPMFLQRIESYTNEVLTLTNIPPRDDLFVFTLFSGHNPEPFKTVLKKNQFAYRKITMQPIQVAHMMPIFHDLAAKNPGWLGFETSNEFLKLVHEHCYMPVNLRKVIQIVDPQLKVEGDIHNLDVDSVAKAMEADVLEGLRNFNTTATKKTSKH